MNLLCRLGIHRRIWTDSAMFVSARMCGVCNEPINKYERIEAEALATERRQWDKIHENQARLDDLAREVAEGLAFKEDQ